MYATCISNCNCLNYLGEVIATISFEQFTELSNSVTLPPGWGWQYEKRLRYAVCLWLKFAKSKVDSKMVRVLNETTALYFVNGKQLDSSHLQRSFTTVEELSSRIADFDGREVCAGFFDQSLADIKVTSKCSGCFIDGIWRSKFCHFLAGKRALCAKCRHLKNYFHKRMEKSKTQHTTKATILIKKKYRRLLKKTMVYFLFKSKIRYMWLIIKLFIEWRWTYKTTEKKLRGNGKGTKDQLTRCEIAAPIGEGNHKNLFYSLADIDP